MAEWLFWVFSAAKARLFGLLAWPFHPAGLAPVPLAPVPPAGRVFSPQLVTADVDFGVQFVKRVIGVDESEI